MCTVQPTSILPALPTAPPEIVGSIALKVALLCQGEVVRWNHETGAESISAVKYIEQLEDELKMLRGQLEDQRTEVGQNDLLEYIKSLDPDALKVAFWMLIAP